MSLTAGVLSQVSVQSTTASLSSTAASGGVGPYTQQWYRSTNPSFSPGMGSLIAGATALTLQDSGLIPNTAYTYKVVFTDTGNSNATVNSTGLAVVTMPATLSQNQFKQTSFVGVLDQKYNYNTTPVQIDLSQATPLYGGAAVKIVQQVAGGVPSVVGCAADDDSCIGFLNYDQKQPQYVAGSLVEMSQSGNVMWLYATAAILSFDQVQLDLTTMGGVAQALADSGANIVGYAMDAAANPGDLIRVKILAPSFQFA